MTGLMGGTRPRMRPGDMERAYDWNVVANGDLKVRKYLAELVEAQATHDMTKASAEAMIAEAGRREAAARRAEADANGATAELATDTAAVDRRHRAERADLDAERLRLDESAKTLAAEQAEMNLSRDQMARAFRAFTKE